MTRPILISDSTPEELAPFGPGAVALRRLAGVGLPVQPACVLPAGVPLEAALDTLGLSSEEVVVRHGVVQRRVDGDHGIVYSRNYQTGTPRPTGVFFPAGQSQPVPLSRTPLFDTLAAMVRQAELEMRDVQAMSFAVDGTAVWILSTQSAVRTPRASVKFAVDMVGEGLIDRAEALRRVSPAEVDAMLAPGWAAGARQTALAAGRLLTRAVPAFRGTACGQVALDPDTVIARLMAGGPPQILLVRDVRAQDVAAFYNSVGVVAVAGDGNSPVALAARKWSVPCVVGASDIVLHEDGFSVRGRPYPDGHWLSLDGSTGEVFSGAVDVDDSIEMPTELSTLLAWADETARVQVYANADSPDEVQRARRWGARGIGLCRTERVLNQTDRMHLVYPLLLLAPDAERADRTDADWHRYQQLLGELHPILVQEFSALFEAMAGCTVTVRLLDAPLNTFLPAYEDLLIDVVQRRRLLALGIDDESLIEAPTLFHLGQDAKGLTLAEKEALLPKLRRAQQHNPGFGLRVCRHGIVYPELYRMQARALFAAAAQVGDVDLQIMVPGVSDPNELAYIEKLVSEAFAFERASRSPADPEEGEARSPAYRFGSMLELPRACLLSHKLAPMCDFFWCGTNDLTQATWGFSNYDATYSYLPVYLQKEILAANPFGQLDVEGVGWLLRTAVRQARSVNPHVVIGICGDQGAEPSGIEFCQANGLNAVSVEPRRVPGARLAAAQAALKE